MSSVKTYLLLFLFLVGLTLSCSRKKETWTSRTYHQMTSNYNGYFYAKESFKEGVIILESQHKENWKDILPIFITGSDQESKNIYPQMDRAIEKCSYVIERHSMVIKKKEENKWIKENYFLIGQAYFYKKDYSEAAKLFDFVIKQYKKEPIKNEAMLMLARTKMEDDEFAKAMSLLKVVQDEPELEPELLSDIRATFADYYIRTEDYKKAIANLEQAIIVTKKKDRKSRLTFILAQLYQRTGQSGAAIASYKNVVKMHPDYEMVFYASINQALAFRSRDGNSEEIKKLLNKMLKDQKNVEFYDQIYFALAEIEMEERHKPEAIAYFKESARVSINNPEQKGISFMTLGDIYMDDRLYNEANTFYDSTLIFLPSDHEKFETIQDLNEGLTELIINLDVLQLQDSLLALASMQPKEREKVLLDLMAAEEEAAEEARLQALKDNNDSNYRSQVDKSVPLSSQGSSGNSASAWYFYNPNTMSSGFTEFKQRWGDRELTDDWRRVVASSTAGVTNSDLEDIAFADLGSNESSPGANLKTMNDYLSEIPLTEKQFAESQKKVEEALYEAGVIYKEKLDDVDNAIEMFDNLVQRFPDSEYLITAYYQLYRLYVKKEQMGNYFGAGFTDNSLYYKELILEEFPYSEYAKLIRNPNYRKEAELTLQQKEEDYKATYRNYKSHLYTSVMNDCNKVIKEEPENPYLPKYYFMKAMVIGSLSDQTNFERELQLLADNFPTTEEGEKAVEILNQLNKSGLKSSDSKSNPTATETTETASIFDAKKDVEHFLALIYPNSLKNVTRVKSAISNFNKKYYSQDRLKVTNSFINKDSQIIIIRRFENGERALSYYNNFVNDNQQLKEINELGLVTFLISSKNFTRLFKSKDIEGYDLFFQENYL